MKEVCHFLIYRFFVLPKTIEGYSFVPDENEKSVVENIANDIKVFCFFFVKIGSNFRY